MPDSENDLTFSSYADAAKYCICELEKNNFEAYVVGGSVRDYLLGKQLSDIDIASSAIPDEVEKVFSQAKLLATGRQHGTLTLLLPAKAKKTKYYQLEITTYRIESEYSDSRHPDKVEFTTSIQRDLSRRDLTINAMAWHPKRGLLDPFNGQSDLEKHILRTVGTAAERFDEDALRILRTLRFASELGFDIEEQTEQALRAAKDKLKLVAPERLQRDFYRLLLGDKAAQVLISYLEVMAVFLPTLKALDKQEIKLNYLTKIDSLAKNITERLAYLAVLCAISDTGTQAIQADKVALSLCQDLKCSKNIRKQVISLSDHAVKKIAPEVLSIDAVKRNLAKVNCAFDSVLRLKQLLNLSEDLSAIKEIERDLSAQNLCGLSSLAIDGNDLKKIGLSGEAIGRVLEKLYELVLLKEVNNEERALLERAQLFVDN